MSAAATLVGVLTQAAASTPDRVAVTDGRASCTYAELEARAARVAAAVQARAGTGSGPVATLLDQDVDAISALYGILRSGHVVVPLDRTAPADALATMLDHSGAEVVVTDASGADAIGASRDVLLVAEAVAPAGAVPAPAAAGIAPDDPASIFYTSGTTGKPKGFVVSHDAQLRGTRSWTEEYGFRADDRIAMVFHHSFGASRVSLYGALAVGAELRIFDMRTNTAPDLAQALAGERVTVLHCAPSLLRALVSHLGPDGVLPDLRLLVTGAEGLERRDVEAFRPHLGRGCRLAYSYAVSEAGPVAALLVDATTELPDGALPIGRPLPAKSIAIDEPDEKGVGEILVTGAGVADGYWRDQAQTAARFFVDADGRRWFRTGDRGRVREDGMLEHRGRIGTLVKVRGYSVDPTEVERALVEGAAVREAAVVLDQTSRPRLVAYVVPDGPDAAMDASSLRAALSQRVPPYMVPTRFVSIDALPRTGRGKVDRRSLPPAPTTRPDLGVPYAAPSDDIERAVTNAWEAVLDVHPVGADDDFFELGGDSLAAAESIAQLQDVLGRDVPLAALLDASTARALAGLLRRGEEQQWGSPVVPLRDTGDRRPFFCVHGGGGNVMLFRPLAARLPADRPFLGLQLRGASVRAVSRMERLAAHYVEHVVRVQPDGPHLLGGYSSGGAVAYEMARQLSAMGQPPALVVMLDTTSPQFARDRLRSRPLRRWSKRASLELHWLAWRARWVRWRLATAVARGRGRSPWRLGERQARFLKRVMRLYRPGPYDGAVLLLSGEWRTREDRGWREVVRGPFEVVDIPGEHRSLLEEPHVAVVAEVLHDAFDRAETSAGQSAPRASA